MAFNPRESGKFIANGAKHVSIKKEGLEKLSNELAKQINCGNLSIESFSQHAVHPQKDDPKAIDWIFVVDTLNFCFWSMEHKEGWTVDGYTGYFALCAAINRAVKENENFLNAEYYSKISKEDLAKVLRSDNDVEIPLFEERLKSLHEVGEILLEKFNGTFKTVVEKAERSAKKLLRLIVDNFPCFRDEATYKDKVVTMYKRAQILIGDVWACYRNHDMGMFNDIDYLTMFADYRVPQSLLYFGVFEYTPELTKTILESPHLKNGDEMEVEIRGCSIHAVELVVEQTKSKLEEGKIINSVLVDHFLWDFEGNMLRKSLT